MSSKQRLPLDLFLSGCLKASIGEKELPVIVVDKSRRRAFSRRVNSDRTRSFVSNYSNSSFCSSVTNCSFGSTSQNAALCLSRWESIPCSRKNASQKALRDSELSLKRPSRTRTNDLMKPPSRTRTNELKKNVSPSPSKKTLKQFVAIRPCRRIRSLGCEGTGLRRELIQQTQTRNASI